VVIILTKIKNSIKSFFKDIINGFKAIGELFKIIWKVTNDVADSHEVKDMGKNLVKSYDVNVNKSDEETAKQHADEIFKKPEKKKQRSISEIVNSFQNPATDDGDDDIPEFADIMARQKAKQSNTD